MKFAVLLALGTRSDAADLFLAAAPTNVAFQPVAAIDDIHAFLRDELNKTFDEVFPFSAEANDYVYEYNQSSGYFSGPGVDGSTISVTSCSGEVSCGGRNNPAKECESNCGPLPTGSYRLSAETVYHNMEHCYVLSQVSGNACGRSGFLIHGGSCSANPSTGCVIIEDPNVRYKIQGGGLLNVVAGGSGGSCKTFQAGLCPGDADCMCTVGDSCSATAMGDAVPRNLSTASGGCSGQCRRVAHNECPGSTSCLKDAGPC